MSWWNRTEVYSGREVVQLSKEAVKEMVGRVNPDLVTAVERGREAAANYQLRTVPISEKDWEAAFERVARRTTDADLKRFAAWRTSLE